MSVRTIFLRLSLQSPLDVDHSFHVPARTGRKDPEVLTEMLDTLVARIESVG